MPKLPTQPPKEPVPLEYFLDVELQVFERVGEKGRLAIPFEKEADARNMKARLWRLKKSLEANKPDDPLTEVARRLIFKLQGSTLILVDRAQSPETNILTQVLKE